MINKMRAPNKSVSAQIERKAGRAPQRQTLVARKYSNK